MTKVSFRPLPREAQEDSGRAVVQGTSTRLYLKDTAKRDVLKELRDLKQKAGAKYKDPASPFLQYIYGGKKAVTWDVLRHCIDRSWRPGSQTWRKANTLAAKLLNTPLKAITDSTPPPGQGGKKRDSLQVSYPTTVSDYRAVIVGQLPRADLHPVVFVRPDDGFNYWYPQHAGRHNPIKAGSAFSCLALVGNPDVEVYSEPSREVQKFHVRVYALKVPWDKGSERFEHRSLGSTLEPFKPEYVAEFTVLRGLPAADTITIEDREGIKWTGRETRAVLPCIAPVTISWTGKEAFVEVREADGDVWRGEAYGASSAIIDITSHGPIIEGATPAHHVLLPKEGLYRVRLHPARPSFLSPLFEWWMEIVLRPVVEETPAAQQPSPKQVSSSALSHLTTTSR